MSCCRWTMPFDRPTERHRPSAARHALYASVICALGAQADAGGYLLFSSEDFLFLRLWQFDNVSVFGRRNIAADAWPSHAGSGVRGDRAVPADSVFRPADALYVV